MQFLLLLSALLSAVTGAFVGPRAVAEQVSQSESQIVSAAQAPTRAVSPEERPQQLFEVVSNRSIIATQFAFLAAAPLTDIRLNE